MIDLKNNQLENPRVFEYKFKDSNRTYAVLTITETHYHDSDNDYGFRDTIWYCHYRVDPQEISVIDWSFDIKFEYTGQYDEQPTVSEVLHYISQKFNSRVMDDLVEGTLQRR